MRTVLLGLLSSAFMMPAVSQAIVREVVRCTTPDGQYEISVLDNQGTSVDRASNIMASIKHNDGVVVGRYQVQRLIAIGPVSFSRPTFVDTATNGAQFKVAGPSTNARNYVFAAQTSVGPMASSALECTSFSGVTF